MNPQEEMWSGSFGDEYTHRNRVDWRARIPFWKSMLDETGARSVYEFGCNAGWNLSAIRRCYPDVALYGVDINRTAANEAKAAGLNVFEYGRDTRHDEPSRYDLTFTAGVLIHVGPNELRDCMQGMIDASAEWVLAVEYSAAQEEEVLYRGHSERLWRRPYGKLYQDMGLEMVRHGPAGKGFDSCTYWLLRKP
jgi:pseudaminic acid biosynthesis-associated methylase